MFDVHQLIKSEVEKKQEIHTYTHMSTSKTGEI